MSSIQQETPTLSLGRSKTTRTSKTWSKGNMLPVSEDEVLDTSELKGSQVAPLEYSEISGGWVRRAKTSVQNRSGNLMRSLTRKLTTYRPISGEDRDFRPAKFDRARALREEEQKALDEGYVGVDLDMFSGFSSAIPTRTAEAMRNNRGNTEYAYTATGEIVDLSTLHGLGGSYDDPDDETGTRRNSFALTRSSTGNGQSEKSYYFPPDPETPNWKPATMRPIYLSILMFLSLCIIGFCEYLYQYSVSKAEQLNGIPHLTRFKAVKDMPLGAFALWKYFPTVIAVIFGVLVQVTDAEVKRVEPYFQLSRKPKGARAADSLNIEYLTFWAILCPLQAIRHKHWAVMISSVAAILSFAAVPPLQSVFLDLKPDVKGGSNSDSEVKWIAVDKVWTRLLEVVMFLIFILIGVLQWILHRRKSGLVGDPSGIAGIAAMANKSHILMDFKGLDMAGTEQIHKQLRKRTYILHKSSLWQAEYLKEHERPTETVKKQNAHPLLLRLEGGIPLIIYLLTMMAFIALAIHWEKLNTPLQKSTTTWLLTAISISIKMFWEVIDRDLRILQPFYLLYKRHAHSDVLTLDYTGTVPAWIIWKTFKNKHYLLTFVCTITVFNEVLTVCMGSLDPSNTEEEETPLSTTLSLVLAELIMGAQVVGIIIVLLLRRKPFLPRQPGTISSVLAYIYASHMLTDFNNMETEPTEKRRKILASKGKSYGFGWFKGLVDGKWHLGIDEEELARGYTHGEDFLGAMLQTVPTGLDQYETAFNMPS
ncbi:hypothetical protein BDZ91DRAFT_418810 [Kalaharituber pfeilii]|nr:hypothetical protein BDZ91DRAFT_418810 [Kalaharituber pfeilii]